MGAINEFTYFFLNDLNMDVWSSTIHNSSKLEATQISSSNRIDKGILAPQQN